MASLIFKTKEIKYTMLEYADESSVLKTLGLFHQMHPTYIAGVIYKDEYREPPVKITREDGKVIWKAKVVNNSVFLDIFKPSGRTGTWIVFHGPPHVANSALCMITGNESMKVEHFEVYKASVGHVAFVTSIEADD